MAGELEPMPLQDILAGVGYKTAMGVWPPGFDVAHALLTLVNVVERLRVSIAAHHENDTAKLDPAFRPPPGPCAICVAAQTGASPADVLTELVVPDFPPADSSHVKQLAVEIVDMLDGCAGFDTWWDEITDDRQEEIVNEIAAIIDRRP